MLLRTWARLLQHGSWVTANAAQSIRANAVKLLYCTASQLRSIQPGYGRKDTTSPLHGDVVAPSAPKMSSAPTVSVMIYLPAVFTRLLVSLPETLGQLATDNTDNAVCNERDRSYHSNLRRGCTAVERRCAFHCLAEACGSKNCSGIRPRVAR